MAAPTDVSRAAAGPDADFDADEDTAEDEVRVGAQTRGDAPPEILFVPHGGVATPVSLRSPSPQSMGEVVADAAPMARVDLGHAWRALPGRARTNENTRRLIARLRVSHRTRAELHWKASQMYLCAHRTFTITIMVVSFVTAVGVNAVNADGTLPEGWINFLSGAVLSLVGVLTAINEFLGYQALEEKHRAAKTGHRNAANFIAAAVARDLDGGPEADFDYGAILDKISEIQTDLQNIDVEIPAWILARHDRAETDAMWLRGGAAAGEPP